jgi:hypothetical protein
VNAAELAAERERSQADSLAAFLTQKCEFDRVVGLLEHASAEHFAADPEALLWDEAAELGRWNEALRLVLAQVAVRVPEVLS